MPILGLADKARTDKKFITDQIRCGVSVIQIQKPDIKDEYFELDVLKNKIPHIRTKDGKTFELINITKKGGYEVRVSKEEYPNSYAKSLGYFVLPPELEALLGKRATSVKILLFIDRPLEEVLKADNCKFESDKRLGCIGNGGIDKDGNLIPGEARRYNYTKGDYESFKPCLCAYSRYFQGKVGSIPKAEAKSYQYKMDKGKVTEMLVQGAWRKVKSTDDTTVFFEELEWQCDLHYELSFITPESEGINLTKFGGSGRLSAERLMSQIDDLQQVLTDKTTGKMRVNSLLIELRIKMETKKEKGKATKIYPAVYLHLPNSIMAIVEGSDSVFSKALIEAPKEETVDTKTGEVLGAVFEDVEEVTDLSLENKDQEQVEQKKEEPKEENKNEPDPYEGTPFAGGK